MPVNRILLELVDERFNEARTGVILQEPKRSNRYVVRFPEEFKDIAAFCVSSTRRPLWIPQQGWCDITIKLMDMIAPSTSRQIFEFIRWQQIGGNSEKGLDFIIELLDPCGLTVERWEIFGLITRIDFGELSYDSDELGSIKLNISPIEINMPFLI